VANITARACKQKISSIYAKNPKAICRRRPSLDFTVWDGNQATLQNAQMMAQQAAATLPPVVDAMTGMLTPAAPPPEVQALLNDYNQGMEKRKVLTKVARTLELVFNHQLEEQQPPFKEQMKAMVRRAVHTGVGYLKLGYRRETEKSPTATAQDNTARSLLASILQRAADLADGEKDTDSAVAEEARQMLAGLMMQMQAGEDLITREGLVFDFPKSTAVIVDPACTQLRGFVGAQWIAQEFLLTPDQILEYYKVDVRSKSTPYSDTLQGSMRAADYQPDTKKDPKGGKRCVWEVYDKTTQLVFTLCDGHHNYLRDPAPPQPKLERFWPIFSLTLNDTEVEANEVDKGVCIFPQSDVRMIMHQQREINRSRDALRGHRISNRPKYLVAGGQLTDADKDKLMSHPNCAVLELQSMVPGQKASDLLQPMVMAPIDPALYETEHVMQDILTVQGSQEANLGPMAGATATEASIAESSRLTSTGSDVDDIDEFLTEVARAAGQVLLLEMSEQTAKSIAGPGGAWPTWNKNEIAKELYLEVEAASTGRPNRNLEVTNFTQLAPLLMQIPGISPEFLAREGIKRLDDRLELEEAFIPALPSIQSMSAPPALPPGEEPGAALPNGAGQDLQTTVPAVTGNVQEATPGQIRSSIGQPGEASPAGF
jgi:hypothetical protein